MSVIIFNILNKVYLQELYFYYGKYFCNDFISCCKMKIIDN